MTNTAEITDVGRFLRAPQGPPPQGQCPSLFPIHQILRGSGHSCWCQSGQWTALVLSWGGIVLVSSMFLYIQKLKQKGEIWCLGTQWKFFLSCRRLKPFLSLPPSFPSFPSSLPSLSKIGMERQLSQCP